METQLPKDMVHLRGVFWPYRHGDGSVPSHINGRQYFESETSGATDSHSSGEIERNDL